jgi:hypothetical protein
MFRKFLIAAVLAVPLMGVLPAAEAKAESPTAALQNTVQTVQNANDQYVRRACTVRTVRRFDCGPRYRHVHSYRMIHHRR